MESRSILKNILVKYPEVDIAKKVLGNISRVENEMNVLDPLLLPAIEMQERERASQQNMMTAPSTAAQAIDAFDMATPPVDSGKPQYKSQLPVVSPEDLQ